MSIESKIEWTEASWSPVVGCSKISQGCQNCYAINHAWRLGHNPNPKINSVYSGLVKKNSDGSLNWTGESRAIESRLGWPLTIKAAKRIFVNPMADLFHKDIKPDFIKKVFEVMRQAYWHTFQILTKRDAIMWSRVSDVYSGWATQSISGRDYVPLPNVWLGVSVEDQESVGRISLLAQTEAAIRFVSCEPLLEAIDLSEYLPLLDLVIVGGESGHRARGIQEQWVRDIKDQCVTSGVAFFFKQKLEGKKKISLPMLDGQRWAMMPAMEVAG